MMYDVYSTINTCMAVHTGLLMLVVNVVENLLLITKLNFILR